MTEPVPPRSAAFGQAISNELRDPSRQLRRAIPDVYAGFAALHDASMADGALSRKHKELIALAIATTEHCDGCIASHARGAAKFGATPEEAAETIGVTILMQGGPATVYGPRAYDAFLEFYEAEQPSS
jgi:AhpD family alkylhydroperoxidase